METPSERHARETRTQEIGGTAGQTHDDVLMRTLGRERGLNVATGVPTDGPVVVGGGPPAREQEAGTGNATPERDVNEELNESKLERHGNVGDAARRDEDGEPR